MHPLFYLWVNTKGHKKVKEGLKTNKKEKDRFIYAFLSLFSLFLRFGFPGSDGG
jgi:hypothetical protein